MPLRFSRGGCKGQNPAPHNAIVENTPGFPHRVEKTVDFSPPFSQPVENYVEKHGMHSRMQPPQTANPGIAAEKHTPRSPVDMHKKPDGQIPEVNRTPHRMSTNAGGQNPRLSHIKQKKSVHNDRFVAVGTPPDTQKSPKTAPGHGFPQSVKAKSGYSAQNRAGKNAKKFLPWLDIPVFHSSPPPTAPASGWKDRRMDGSRAGAREAESGQTLTERAGRHFPLSHYIY